MSYNESIGHYKSASLTDAVADIGKAIVGRARQTTTAMEAAGKIAPRAVTEGVEAGKQGYQMAANTGVGDWMKHQGARVARRVGNFMQTDPGLALGAGAAGVGLAGYGAYRGVAG